MISIIVPVAPGDDSWRVLLQELSVQSAEGRFTGCEVLFVSADKSEVTAIQQKITTYPPSFGQQCQAHCAGNSRATAMNAGTRLAEGDYLWFVHADSRIETRHIHSLRNSLRVCPDALHYFNLRFYGHPMMWLNALGVWLRSHCLVTPFGDQALCISRQNFLRVGAYPEDVKYGEDHTFVWHALQQGVRLRCTGTALLTSARKYEKNGWLKTTGLHVYLWARQAWPEFKVLLKQRWHKV
ncbi:MAG: glycosyl transferase family 2 [Gammaproteobacteria bacterium]|nr:MAG: glycosyl transferase family 2 [Gammaproteobacteria bacterium]